MFSLLSACANEDPTMQDAVFYANILEFHNHTGSALLLYETFKGMGYTNFVFVHSDEEFVAGSFSEDTVVAWPSLYARCMLAARNNWIRENEKQSYIEQYSLEYPLTVEDLVDNWQNMLDVLLHIGQSNRIRYLEPYASREVREIMRLEIEVLRDAFEVAGIDVTEYSFEYPIRSWQIGQIMLELYGKLAEDVQLQLLMEMPNVMAAYNDERRSLERRQLNSQ